MSRRVTHLIISILVRNSWTKWKPKYEFIVNEVDV